MSILTTVRFIQEESNEETCLHALARYALPAFAATVRAGEISVETQGETENGGARQARDSRQGADRSCRVRWRQKNFQHAVFLCGESGQ